ncbi:MULTISPECIES: porin [Pseudomonas syringae group]|uniref:porin n=1 Tax=Pseudomonas syringae group TaxID=136849 RepID=UPI001604BD46|nr:porin [Pseudomonas syringae group genomosp. 3]
MASTSVAMLASAASLEEQEESGLTLYGTIDIGMATTRASGESAEKGLLSGGQTDSLWGLRGREPLSEDSYAMFTLESGIDLANGRREDPDRLFNYQSWLGLGDQALGELRIGRQNTVGQAFVSEIEVSSWKDFGMGALMRASDNYQVPNQISWRSPQWAGTQIGASYSFDESEADTHTRSYSLAARYESGPWLVAASFEQLSQVPVAVSGGYRPNAWQLAGSYDLGVARVAAGWSRQSNGFVGRNGGDTGDGAAQLDNPGLQGLGPIEFVDGGRLDAMYLGTAIPFGEGKFQLQWSMARPDWVWQETGAQAKLTQVMSVGYVHTLSTRTSLYAFAARGRGYSMEDVVSAEAPNVQRIAVGLTHNF